MLHQLKKLRIVYFIDEGNARISIGIQLHYKETLLIQLVLHNTNSNTILNAYYKREEKTNTKKTF